MGQRFSYSQIKNTCSTDYPIDIREFGRDSPIHCEDCKSKLCEKEEDLKLLKLFLEYEDPRNEFTKQEISVLKRLGQKYDLPRVRLLDDDTEKTYEQLIEKRYFRIPDWIKNQTG